MVNRAAPGRPEAPGAPTSRDGRPPLQRLTDRLPAWTRSPRARRGLLLFSDLGFAVLAAALTCGAIAFNFSPSPRPPDALAYTLGLLIGVAALARRRYPLIVLLATACLLFSYYALGYPPIEASVPLAVALYSSALRGQWRWCTGVSVFFVIADIATRGRGADFFRDLPDLVEVAGLLLAVILLGETVRTRHERAVEARRRVEQAERDKARDLADRISAERLRIARDMHDIVGHTLAAITLQAGLARDVMTKDPARASDCMTSIRQASSEAVDELRRSIGALREDGQPEAPTQTVGLADVERLVALAVDSGVEVTTDVDTVGLAPASDVAAYRIVQEALTNVVRHSGATHALVRIRQTPHAVRVEVRDDGPRRSGGFEMGNGIVGMRERAAAVGGALTAGPVADGPGFRVQATLPTGYPTEDDPST